MRYIKPMLRVFLLVLLFVTVIKKRQISGFFSERISQGCRNDIRTIKDFQSPKKFYLQSSRHDTIITVLCSGHVVAKDLHSCHGNDIRSAWRASCGNVAFMPCDQRATLAEGTRFEICLAGFNQQKLVYDMQQKSFKITSLSNHLDHRYLQAYVFRSNKVIIGVRNGEVTDNRKLKVQSIRTNRSHGRLDFLHLTNGTHINAQNSFHLNIHYDISGNA